MRTVPIPGKILETEVFYGLTFDELVVMGAIPLVVTMPSLFIEQIPTVVSLLIAGVVFVVMVAIAVSTPEGQSPLEWAPAAFERRIGPDTYYLRPDESSFDRSTYLSARHADRTDSASTGSATANRERSDEP